MSSPIYSNGRYGANGNGRLGAQLRSWDDLHDGTREYSDRWKRPGWLSKTEASEDHVCRPVIVRADGSMIPVLSCPPGHGKHNGVSMVPEVLSCPPGRGELLKDYMVGNNRYQEEIPKIKEFFGDIHNVASNGRRADFQTSGYQNNNGFGRNGWNSPAYGRNEYAKAGVQEHTTLVTNGGWVQPSRTGWATPPGYEGQRNKATNNIDKALNLIDRARPTATVTDGGWGRPSRTGWATSPGYEGQTSKATNNIDRALTFIESRRPLVPTRYSTSATATATIDGREAAKKYGQYNW